MYRCRAAGARRGSRFCSQQCRSGSSRTGRSPEQRRHRIRGTPHRGDGAASAERRTEVEVSEPSPDEPLPQIGFCKTPPSSTRPVLRRSSRDHHRALWRSLCAKPTGQPVTATLFTDGASIMAMAVGGETASCIGGGADQPCWRTLRTPSWEGCRGQSVRSGRVDQAVSIRQLPPHAAPSAEAVTLALTLRPQARPSTSSPPLRPRQIEPGPIGGDTGTGCGGVRLGQRDACLSLPDRKKTCWKRCLALGTGLGIVVLDIVVFGSWSWDPGLWHGEPWH